MTTFGDEPPLIFSLRAFTFIKSWSIHNQIFRVTRSYRLRLGYGLSGPEPDLSPALAVRYEEQREPIREAAMRAKAERRVHVGPHLTFLFENQDTIRYQVLEMVRTERMVKDADTATRSNTYNELLGARGELGATLLIELDDAALRADRLTQWLALPSHLNVLRANGQKAYARFDTSRVGDTRVSSVQYLKFDVGDQAPLAIGCDHPDPELRHETELTTEPLYKPTFPSSNEKPYGHAGESDY